MVKKVLLLHNEISATLMMYFFRGMGFFYQFALTHNCSQSLCIHRRQGNRKELKYAELGHRCFPSEVDIQLGFLSVSEHLASDKHLLRHQIVDKPFFCPVLISPFPVKKPSSWHEVAVILENTYWHDLSANITGEKGGNKILGKMGHFSERLFALNSVQCHKTKLEMAENECQPCSYPGGRATAMGDTDPPERFQCVLYCHFCWSLHLSVQGTVS